MLYSSFVIETNRSVKPKNTKQKYLFMFMNKIVVCTPEDCNSNSVDEFINKWFCHACMNGKDKNCEKLKMLSLIL